MFCMKKGFRLLTLAMLMLMLRYTLMPHQFMAYAHDLEMSQQVHQLQDAKHRDFESRYVVTHPEQFVLNTFVVDDYLAVGELLPVQWDLSQPVIFPHVEFYQRPPDRGPPWPHPVPLHIPSTHLLI